MRNIDQNKIHKIRRTLRFVDNPENIRRLEMEMFQFLAKTDPSGQMIMHFTSDMLSIDINDGCNIEVHVDFGTNDKYVEDILYCKDTSVTSSLKYMLWAQHCPDISDDAGKSISVRLIITAWSKILGDDVKTLVNLGKIKYETEQRSMPRTETIIMCGVPTGDVPF